MSSNDSHPGRGLRSALRNLFRSPSSPRRRRASQLLRRGRTMFSTKHVIHHPPGSHEMSDPVPVPVPAPAAIFGFPISEAPQSVNSKGDASFDVFEWYPHYQSCQRYFLDNAQHSSPVQALSAYLNIRLPFQRQPPVHSSSGSVANDVSSTPTDNQPPPSSDPDTTPSLSLLPYIRRLVATGMDYPGVLHGFFGDDWQSGIGTLHEQERRNYLFAAKSGGWAAVKQDYDIPPLETIPFLRPLQGPMDAEIEAAERSWSDWLAMEDWMVGPRAPDALRASLSLSPSLRPRSLG